MRIKGQVNRLVAADLFSPGLRYFFLQTIQKDSEEMSIVKQYAPDGFIKISWYVKSTDCLGPFLRYALWLQGCERRCKGCIAREMQPSDGGYDISIEKLSELIACENKNEGITISGGEPFYQADKICELIEKIKSVRNDFGVVIYTGYTIEELRSSGEYAVNRLLDEYTDILIDGSYIEELDDNAGLRGSSNQRFIMLTERYRDKAYMYESLSGRKNNFIISDDKFQMVGIPSAVSKEILKKLKVIPSSPAVLSPLQEECFPPQIF